MIARKIAYSNRSLIGINRVVLHISDIDVGNNTAGSASGIHDVTTLCHRVLIFPYYVRSRSNLRAVGYSQNRISRCSICASRGSFEDVLNALEKELKEYNAKIEHGNKEAEINRMWSDVGSKIERMITEEWRIAALNGEQLPHEFATYGALLNFYERNIPEQTIVHEGFIEHEPGHEEG